MHEEALACELAAYLYLDLGEKERAVEYFLLAREKYDEWVSVGLWFHFFHSYLIFRCCHNTPKYVCVICCAKGARGKSNSLNDFIQKTFDLSSHLPAWAHK